MTKKSEQAKQDVLFDIKHVYLLQFFKQDASTPNRMLINQVICLTRKAALYVIFEGMSSDERGLFTTGKFAQSIITLLGGMPFGATESPVKLFGLEIYRVAVSHLYRHHTGDTS